MDTETPLLVVAIVGVTSPQGDGVARKFLSLRDWQVRAVTDEEAEEKVTELAEWAAKGVNVVRADFHDPGNLAMAFAGADAIFCATSFTRLFVEHSTISWYSLTKINPANLVRQFESSRNQNVIQAASLIPTLQKMVLSVDPSPKHFSAGRITHAYHMDAKWEAMKVLKLKYPILAQKTSILQVGRFMDRYKLYLQKSGDGTFRVSSSLSGDVRIPWVHPRSDVGNFVRALICDLPPGLNVACVSQYLSWNEFCYLFTRVSGIRTWYQQHSFEEFSQRNPFQAQLWLAEEKHIQACGFYGVQQDLLHSGAIWERFRVQIPTHTFEDYLPGDLPTFPRNSDSAREGSGMGVLGSNVRPGVQGATATSQAAVAQGSQTPTQTSGYQRD